MAHDLAARIVHLRFLEGRWRGLSPDGTLFFEEYVFLDGPTMHVTRFADARFDAPQDRSTVAAEDGRVTSRWRDFVWEASQLEEGVAAFDPVNAPGAFVWRQVSPAVVDVVQQWVDETGAHEYTVRLERVKTGPEAA